MAFLLAGNRGGKILVHDGFRYQRNRTRSGKMYWRCWRQDCRVPLQTNMFDINANQPDIRVLSVGQHHHQNDQSMITSASIVQRMNNAVVQDPTMTCRQVYDEVVVSVPRQEQDDIPSFATVSSVLERTRAREIPEIPQSIVNVDIQGRWRRTKDGERFLSHLDNNWGIAVFMSSRAARCLGACNDIYLDGTFRTTLRPYTQFLTVHSLYQDRVIPLAFVLMDGRHVGQYRQVFANIKRKYNRLTNNMLAPTNIVCDFETGMISAAETEFPRARICGCFFHFCKSIWRRVQREGLAAPYGRNDNMKRCIRKLMALAFVPVLLVRANFGILQQDNATRRLFRRFHGLRELFRYFQRNYLDGQFPVGTWNVYDRNMDNRTNNHVESFNRRWNTNVGRRHPNIWFFINKLRKEETRSQLSVAAVNRGDEPPRRRRKYRVLQARMDRLKASYVAGTRTLTEYWNAMIYAVAQFH